MQCDDLIECKRCKGDAAYVQKINDDITITQCYGCGFISNSLMKVGSKFLEEQMELLPNLYKELMGEDEDGNVWMPTTINLPSQGMIFANGTSYRDWRWAAVKSVPVLDEEKEKYPIPSQPGKFYSQRMDMDTLKEFDEHDFMNALEFVGVFENVKEERTEDIKK